MSIIDINEEAIKSLLEAYGIPNCEAGGWKSLSGLIVGILLWKVNEGEKIDYDKRMKGKKLVELIKKLRSCKDDYLQFVGFEKNAPFQKIKVEVTDSDCISLIDCLLSTMLYYEQEEIEQLNIFKDYCKEDGEMVGWFREPFTDEELEKIGDYYTKREEFFPKKNAKLGNVANRILDYLMPLGLGFTDTKLYSFVYDAMLIGNMSSKEKLEDEGEQREKYQYVRSWLRAYKSYSEEMCDDDC